jgi:putative ABC transport system permease protein
MNTWLNDFPYRVNLSIWIFAVAVAAAIMVAFLTVAFQSLRIATSNPVKDLRTE